MSTQKTIGKLKRWGMRAAVALILALPGTAGAAEYFFTDFVTAGETALGTPASKWEYNNTSLAPWTAGWDGVSSLTFDFGLPLAPGENHRLRAPLPTPKPTLITYPYTQVKVTFSGIPAGETALFQIREEIQNPGGDFKRTWPVSNGTYVFTLDAQDTANHDNPPAAAYNVNTTTYNRLRLQIDLTTIAGYTNPGVVDGISASIDYAVITDDPNYGVTAYTLTYTAGPGGTISGTSPQTVNAGTDGSPVTAVPNPGFAFTGWSDGVSTATRTDTNVLADLSVTANFVAQYTLNYTAGPGGSITGTSPQTVNAGGSGSPVTAVANSGFTFTGWSDGVSTATRTDTNVTANLSVTANFTADSEGEGSPEGALEGEGEGVPQNVSESYSAEVGQNVEIIVSNAGSADPNSFSWTFTPNGSSTPLPILETTGTLTIFGVTEQDAGTYVASFDDGSKAPNTYTAVLSVVAALPAGSSLAVVFAAALVALAGTRIVRQTSPVRMRP